MKALPLLLFLLGSWGLPLHANTTESPAAAYESSDLQLEGNLHELKTQAEAGDAAAMRQLYMRYAVEGHTAQAKAWAEKFRAELVKKADAGDTKAMLLLGSNYLAGREYTDPDPAKAAVWLSKATEAGEPTAAYILGDFFTKQGNTTDGNAAYARAYTEYCKLAESGNINALYWQGYMLQNGLGTPADAAAGIAKMEQAAKKGNAWALAQLFKTYAQGLGVAKDDAKAIAYARQAADATKDALMAYATACAYLNGQGVEKDEKLGEKYLNLAVAGNLADAIFLKATRLELAGKPVDAYTLYNQAASMGQSDAMVHAGRMQLYGTGGVQKDEARGLSMLQAACDRLNSARAPLEIARYYDSIGEAELANAWYVTASDRGVAEAMARRGLLHLNPFSGLKWNPTLAYQWWSAGKEAGDATCTLYVRLFLYVFIPVLLILVFGVPAFIVHHLNRKAQNEANHAS